MPFLKGLFRYLASGRALAWWWAVYAPGIHQAGCVGREESGWHTRLRNHTPKSEANHQSTI